MSEIVDRLNAAFRASFDAGEREIAARAVADTLAVAAAGYCLPSVVRVSHSYEASGQSAIVGWNGAARSSDEDAALVDAMAAHALDFDDFDTVSSAHLSCIIVPVILAEKGPWEEDGLLDAILAGTLAAGELAAWFGPDHYRRGWHATSTIGTLAACVSLARLKGLTVDQLMNSIAIASSQLSGVQANFGTDTKALHAGFAAVSARRAVRMASLGLTGNVNILEHVSFMDNYGSVANALPWHPVAIPGLADRQLIKIYPCCFAIHRALTATLEARKALGEAIFDDDIRFAFTLPSAAHAILVHDEPTNGVQAAFSTSYCCAAALLHGSLAISHFAERFGDRRISELMSRISVQADDTSANASLSEGQVSLNVYSPFHNHRFVCRAVPGSAQDPAFAETFRMKIDECLSRYSAAFDREFPVLATIGHLARVRAYFD